ncbi:M15 family metallopeptidase [Streptomyces albireticuli]|uniref:M15 family metallopeptidase n=1 Tax=Streptomyces albireticuli TaxID=1940 RepID=UPI001F37FD62|nr:M15 family metallopeptidase [Streptomyces albireticuli]
MILLSDPRVLALPVRDCGEPLTEITATPGVLLDPRERDAAGAYGRARTGVLNRLQQAARALPCGIRFLVIEGHRTAHEQQRRFDRYEDRLRSEGVTDRAELRRRTSTFASPIEVAPHCAGAALDITLADTDGRELAMGGAVNAHRSGDTASCPLDAPGLPEDARHHRALLVRAMTSAGFVSYPSEWWHWSHGDRYGIPPVPERLRRPVNQSLEPLTRRTADHPGRSAFPRRAGGPALHRPQEPRPAHRSGIRSPASRPGVP